MITSAQRRYIEAHAYVPEHLPAYVTAITAARPYLFGDYLAYAADDRLIFVGYPLSGAGDEAAWLSALDTAAARIRPRLIAITAAALPAALADCPASSPDAYYRLDLADVRPDKKLRNLLRRAERELTVRRVAGLDREHRGLVDAFLVHTPVDESTRFIYERLERYAGRKGRLVSGIAALAGLLGQARGRRETPPPAPPLHGETPPPAPLLHGEIPPPAPPLHGEGSYSPPSLGGKGAGGLGAGKGELGRPGAPLDCGASAPLLRSKGEDRGMDRPGAPLDCGASAPLLRSKGEDRGMDRPGAPLILEARDAAGRLVAFDIATCAAGEYAFYLFNFRARECYVPGASDLLLARLIELARAAGKRYLNLGLGINAGVRGFKEKWGAMPFLPHLACAWERPRAAWEEALAL